MAAEDSEVVCRGCGGIVRVQGAGSFGYRHGMHRLCFHYEFEHGERDVDAVCGDPRCPSRLVDAPGEAYWFFGPRYGPMKAFTEAGLSDGDVREAMDAGVDDPDAIIARGRARGAPSGSADQA